ncbi:MAG: chromosome segregation protein SMC [Thermoguttaceae bacterium]|jgi:chromosome segregation protein|nr:chromosome segregation protein SMC [Thermoguttaceae bacterium]
MLKALEIAGFKSFADRTRFEFPPGITVVVGPNGSGKSNIVDAIKWVLGEQSIKSLRGREMADVIFNGSGTRRPMNSAEITLTFNNAGGLLAVDSPEVHITRRVYRSGESEYLINRQPGRLRDIRDLLAGTGMGTQAYSVIEQGKVDVLLQSSPRDRRMIFEEAAGISRFKARKIEALRRLDRVDQNLLRLGDIVDEVETRLRGVRMQAGKARRYREYTERLQELRTQVGLVDWRRLSDELAGFEKAIDQCRQNRDSAAAEAELAEAAALEVDSQIGELTEALRRRDALIAEGRERIANRESTIEHERNRLRDHEAEVARCRRQLAGMNVRAGELRQQLSVTDDEVQEAERQYQAIARSVTEGERSLTETTRHLDRVRGETEQRRGAYVELMRSAATLGNEASSLQSQVDAAEAARGRCTSRLADVDQRLDRLAAELADLKQQELLLAEESQSRHEASKAAASRLAEVNAGLARGQSHRQSLAQQHSAAAERAALLEELEQRQEGLGAGVKEVLAAAGRPDPGPYRAVCGVLADLLQVSVEVAPLIEVALGHTAQYVVVENRQPLIDFLQEENPRFAGRVGFFWLGGDATAAQHPGTANLDGQPGVMGRADRFVEADPRFQPLVGRLLAGTWIVENLGTALQLARQTRGVNFVTVTGEWLQADGVLTVGPRHEATGLISRRSQLRALAQQLVELQTEVENCDAELARLDASRIEAEHDLDQSRRAEQEAADALATHRFRISGVRQQQEQLAEQHAALDAELRAAETQHQTASAQLAEAAQRRSGLESELADLEARLAGLDEQIGRIESQRQSQERETTQVKVELAKSEERLRNLHTRRRQFEEHHQERRRAIADSRERLAQSLKRADAARWAILRAESEVAELYLRKESFHAEIVSQLNQRETLHGERSSLAERLQKARAAIRRLDEQLHERDLAASEVRHRRSALADRLREDYGIELGELEHQPTGEEQHERDQVQEEIDELRRKIGNLGNVNLEALEELQQLEGRHQGLFQQHQDLVKAKDSLVRIIDRIDTDSRRLFSETLETVRGHFQTLFRDLFGGGRADIVLDEGVDILDSGIEIVARPPGKEPRSISLLSGGEKTLTCVAMLLAIFRSRPSPFCVLDEVDAALDEANIDRFTKVLKDFLAWTQFIIVTHSKKTMTSANTLYGVTMQESGVSKQVSVRFEDVSEDGEISQRALTGDEETQAA